MNVFKMKEEVFDIFICWYDKISTTDDRQLKKLYAKHILKFWDQISEPWNKFVINFNIFKNPFDIIGFIYYSFERFLFLHDKRMYIIKEAERILKDE